MGTDTVFHFLCVKKRKNKNGFEKTYMYYIVYPVIGL